MTGVVAIAADDLGAFGILVAVGVCTLLECSVGLGVLLPAETVIVAAAAAAAGDVVPLWAVLLVAVVFAATGDCIGYLVGRQWGRRLIERNAARVRLTPERIDQVEVYVSRWGAPGIVVGRFLPGVRILVMPVAGAACMPWRRFVVADIIGVVG